MKAHYTTFEGKEQFDVLRDKACQLGDVCDYIEGETFFGLDTQHGSYISYDLIGHKVSGYYQEATYLPYNEYLDYLDRCIKDKDNESN